jgi:16S rRNA C1402 (ribose-2'-O) methylase RsmI
LVVNVKHVDLILSETTTTTKKSLPEYKKEEVHTEKDHSEKDHSEKDKHEETKLLIIGGSVVIGIISLFIYEIY